MLSSVINFIVSSYPKHNFILLPSAALNKSFKYALFTLTVNSTSSIGCIYGTVSTLLPTVANVNVSSVNTKSIIPLSYSPINKLSLSNASNTCFTSSSTTFGYSPANNGSTFGYSSAPSANAPVITTLSPIACNVVTSSFTTNCTCSTSNTNNKFANVGGINISKSSSPLPSISLLYTFIASAVITNLFLIK